MPSMELDDEDKGDLMQLPMPVASDFPVGLRGCLTEREFAKMDVDPADLSKGDLVHFTECFARITNVSHSDGDMGKTCRVEFQIEHMNIEDETAEDE